MGAYSKGGLFNGGFRNVPGGWLYSSRNFLLKSYFFNATNTSNRMICKGQANCH